MKNNEGFVVPLLLGIIVLLVVGGGVYIYQNKKVEVPNVIDVNTQQSGQVKLGTNTNNTSSDIPTWKTYTNSQYGFEVKYPSDIFRLYEAERTLSHTLKNFHTYSQKDGSDLGLASDISLSFNAEDGTSKGCDYLEKTLNIKSLGVPFKLGSIEGMKYEMGAEGVGVVSYCIKNADASNKFNIMRGFMTSSYSTELNKQGDFISEKEQERIANQILSTFKFTKPATTSLNTNVTLDMTNQYAKTYKTLFTAEFAKEANLDGHFRVVAPGCGSSCINIYALDKNTGKVYVVGNGGSEYQIIGNQIRIIGQEGQVMIYIFNPAQDKFQGQAV